ncbi:MAG: endonuclease/exonuclease/phosphatase family protein [Rhodospirillaceae bacterium]|nr:endonuclease/exonuclease/phosphatase family protein [Rhodospirillaceae bacterium]
MTKTALRIVSWNVNSIRKRIGQLEKLTDAHAPDVICLQETKANDTAFPFEAMRALGFAHIAAYGYGGYNGVAILSKHPLKDVVCHTRRGKRDGRHISAVVRAKNAPPVSVHSLYVPAGGEAPDPRINSKFADKLSFIDCAADYFAAEYGFRDAVVLTGDLNIAPLPSDVWDHHKMQKRIGHTDYDIAALDRLKRSLNWTDAVREIIPPDDPVFTWWSYRQSEFKVDSKGWRLDHIWVSPGLKGSIQSAEVLVDVRHWTPASDHAPVLVKLKP